MCYNLCQFGDDLQLVRMLQGIPDINQVYTLKSAHHKVEPSIQHTMRINLRRGNAEFAVHMLSNGEVRLEQSSLIGWVKLDDMAFTNSKDDTRSKGGIRSIAKSFESLSRKLVPLTDDPHR